MMDTESHQKKISKSHPRTENIFIPIMSKQYTYFYLKFLHCLNFFMKKSIIFCCSPFVISFAIDEYPFSGLAD